MYHPYNPAQVQALLDLLRFERNWCKPGADGQTPAMRAGAAARPLDLAAVLEGGGEDLRLVHEAEALLAAQRGRRGALRRDAPVAPEDPAPAEPSEPLPAPAPGIVNLMFTQIYRSRPVAPAGHGILAEPYGQAGLC